MFYEYQFKNKENQQNFAQDFIINGEARFLNCEMVVQSKCEDRLETSLASDSENLLTW